MTRIASSRFAAIAVAGSLALIAQTAAAQEKIDKQEAQRVVQGVLSGLGKAIKGIFK